MNDQTNQIIINRIIEETRKKVKELRQEINAQIEELEAGLEDSLYMLVSHHLTIAYLENRAFLDASTALMVADHAKKRDTIIKNARIKIANIRAEE